MATDNAVNTPSTEYKIAARLREEVFFSSPPIIPDVVELPDGLVILGISMGLSFVELDKCVTIRVEEGISEGTSELVVTMDVIRV